MSNVMLMYVTFTMSIKTNIRKIFNTFRLSFLCMAIKNTFSCHRIVTKIEFNCHNFRSPQFMIEKFLGAPWIFFSIIWLKTNIDLMIKKKSSHCPNKFQAFFEKFGRQVGQLKIFNRLDQSCWAMPKLYWQWLNFLSCWIDGHFWLDG